VEARGNGSKVLYLGFPENRFIQPREGGKAFNRIVARLDNG
jgi:hypothetical protein